MSRRALSSRHSIDSCTIQLHSWRPFKAPDSSDYPHTPPPKPYSPSSNGAGCSAAFHPKRPCLSDRTTSPFTAADAIDLSRLSLFEDDRPIDASAAPNCGSFRLIAKKRRRRRGSRSVSGRSSDRSGTRRCCSIGASAAYGTCSDFPVAIGTDSSGELFGNGDWGSDASEAQARNSKRDKDGGGGSGSGEKENSGSGFGQIGTFDAAGNESGYGSEPGYRGDAEFGYGDEIDEEEDDSRIMFWGEQFGEKDSKMEMVGENTFSDQKSHHRGRRKKHDCKMVDSSR